MTKPERTNAPFNYQTPRRVFDALDAEFKFTLDPCADATRLLCPRNFTADVDGLSQTWAPERVFVNPPWGMHLRRWVAKCASEAAAGALVVALIPASVTANWWHDHVVGKAAFVRFYRGRIKFDWNGAPTQGSFATCALVCWQPGNRATPTSVVWSALP